ncbi:MAG: peptidylprolyl isomerase [Bacteroidetes bacterium]|nr:MAG: peptidylprolyl isomerase [Bacteroidota bacterium]
MNKIAIVFAVILFSLTACHPIKKPTVTIQTEMGDIVVELYPNQAPYTVYNFLKYVDENRYNGATFYRTVTMSNQPGDSIKIEVIQGGLYEDNHPQALPPINHETTKTTGIKHLDGTISMARNEPGTATSEFFICIGAQPELDYGGKRNPDGRGFAAFGRVIEGMDVVRAIHNSPAKGQMLTPRIKILGMKGNREQLLKIFENWVPEEK